MLQRAKCFGSRLSEVENFIEELFEDDMHAKRVESLANATAPLRPLHRPSHPNQHRDFH